MERIEGQPYRTLRHYEPTSSIGSFQSYPGLVPVSSGSGAQTMPRRKKKIKGYRRSPKELHEKGLSLYREGRIEEALAQLCAVLKEEENSERWNDWAAVQHALGSEKNAEAGFRRALELDKNNQEASTNLGCMLVGLGRYIEAAPFLLVALNTTNEAQRAAVEKLIAQIPKPTNSTDPDAGGRKRDA